MGRTNELRKIKSQLTLSLKTLLNVTTTTTGEFQLGVHIALELKSVLDCGENEATSQKILKQVKYESAQMLFFEMGLINFHFNEQLIM